VLFGQLLCEKQKQRDKTTPKKQMMGGAVICLTRNYGATLSTARTGLGVEP